VRSTSTGYPDKTEIEHALDARAGILDALLGLSGKHHVAVLAAQADGPFAFGIDQRDDFLVDRAGQHHLDHFHGALVGDAQAAFELGFDAEFGQHRGNLRAATMHDDRVDPALL